MQVSRLRKAAEAAAAAVSAAEAAGLPSAERKVVADLRDRYKGEAERAARENSSIYQVGCGLCAVRCAFSLCTSSCALRCVPLCPAVGRCGPPWPAVCCLLCA